MQAQQEPEAMEVEATPPWQPPPPVASSAGPVAPVAGGTTRRIRISLRGASASTSGSGSGSTGTGTGTGTGNSTSTTTSPNTSTLTACQAAAQPAVLPQPAAFGGAPGAPQGEEPAVVLDVDMRDCDTQPHEVSQAAMAEWRQTWTGIKLQPPQQLQRVHMQTRQQQMLHMHQMQQQQSQQRRAQAAEHQQRVQQQQQQAAGPKPRELVAPHAGAQPVVAAAADVLLSGAELAAMLRGEVAGGPQGPTQA
jgi:hypothetical protein